MCVYEKRGRERGIKRERERARESGREKILGERERDFFILNINFIILTRK